MAAVSTQHVGARDQQHDSIYSEPGLHIVCDGNGVLGDCSAKAIERFRHHLHEARALALPIENALEKAIRCADDDLCTYLRAEVTAAIDSWRNDPRATEALGMLGREFFEGELSSGSTIVAFVDDTHVVHVGDSRAYRLRPATRELTQLTRDHVWPEDDESVNVDGTIYKHGLAMQRVLGHYLLRPHGVTSEPDITPVTLADGELLLLCSDGLHPFLERDDRIFDMLARPVDIIEEAAAIASDNVSLILIGR